MTQPDPSHFVFTCLHCLKQGLPILRAVRDTPCEPGDSGWQLHCGGKHTESDAAITSVQNLLTKDPSLREILGSPAGSVFTRRDTRSPWTAEQPSISSTTKSGGNPAILGSTLPDRANIASMEAKVRYEYFLHTLVSTGTTYGLYEKAWATLDAPGDKLLFPLWPDAGFASDCKPGGWEENEPRAIPLSELLKDWLPSLQKDKLGLAIFMTPDDDPYKPTMAKFKQDLLRVQKTLA